MNVSLTKAQEKYIARRVKNQEYQTASELVREAMRMHMEAMAERQAIREAIKQGEEDIAKGRYTDIRTPEDMRNFMDRIKRTGRAKLAAKRKARAA
jgi:antitoxin ParD1/3/4